MTFSMIAFDVETSGTLPEYALQPYRAKSQDAWLTSAAWHGSREVMRLPELRSAFDWRKSPDIEDIRKVLRYCAENRITILAWNAPFDAAWLIALGLRDEVFACKWLDGMVVAKHLSNIPTHERGVVKISLRLKSLVGERWPHRAGYDEDVDFHTTDLKELYRLKKYNKRDCIYTYELTCGMWKRISKRLQRVILIEAASIPLVADSLVTGISVDADALDTLEAGLSSTASTNLGLLRIKYGVNLSPDDYRSPTKLGELLYDKWGLLVRNRTPSGRPSVDRNTLKELSTNDPRCQALLKYREALTNADKFVQGTRASLEYNPDQYTRPQARIFGTYSGRMTYFSKQGKGKDERPTGVPIHQWKRDPEFRRVLRAPEGYQLLEFDFSGQEFRWMAVVANDEQMLELCQPGRDAHAYMGSIMVQSTEAEVIAGVKAGDPDMKRARTLGKVANLSLQYRTSATRLQEVSRFQYGVPISLSEARSLHATYQVSYPNVPNYWNRQQAWVRRHSYVPNMLGRVVRFMNYTPSRRPSWAYASTAINYPIQSMGAEQKYLALCLLRDYMNAYDARFYFELHDGLFIIVPNAKAEKAAHKIRHMLTHIPYDKAWKLIMPIEFPVDAKMGPSWGDLKDVEGA